MDDAFEEVSTEALLKLYGPTRALSGVSLQFRSGEITVVEGPNGSGKSTLLSLLALTAKPTAGRIRFGTREVRKLGVEGRRAIGLLSHEPMLYPELTGRENLRFFSTLFLPPTTDANAIEDRITALSDRFVMKSFLDRATRTYSRGQLQRVALSRTLLHQPKLLLLDEPSTGLDSKSTDALWTAVERERSEGRIIIVVTHDSNCAARLAARRVVLSKGRVALSEPGRGGVS